MKFIQPIHQHEDGLINTYRCKLLDYNNINGSMICLDDIAKGLANNCRFTGQIEDFYSVAEHTLLVWFLCPDELKPAALLHDASEAFTGDMNKVLKEIVGEPFKKIENKLTEVIFDKYGVSLELLKHVKPYDKQALEIENNYFRFGKLDLISNFYSINELIKFEKPYRQLLALLREQFLQRELFYNP